MAQEPPARCVNHRARTCSRLAWKKRRRRQEAGRYREGGCAVSFGTLVHRFASPAARLQLNRQHRTAQPRRARSQPASQPPPEKVKKRKGAPAPGQCHGEVRGDASVPRSFASVATCPLRLRYQISFLLAASSVLSVGKLKMQLWVSNPDCRRNASFPGHVHARRRAASCGWNSSKVIHVFNSGRRSSLNWSSVLPNSFLCSSLAPIT